MSHDLLPLKGIRVHLSGSVPEDASVKEAEAMRSFVEVLVRQILQSGGSVIHGSHPTLMEPLERIGKSLAKTGTKASLVLVRSSKFFQSDDQKSEVDQQRSWATVQVIPSVPGDPNANLVPMREWMADRSDVIIAIGGKWASTDLSRAGVPIEIEYMLERGKSAFVIGNFGGSTKYLLESNNAFAGTLLNGWSGIQNLEIANLTNSQEIVDRILGQIKLLPLLRNNCTAGRRFRILALDGGGIRGAFTAAALSAWSDIEACNDGRDLIKHFDLVAGTSTGGILAIGLGLGFTPLEMLRFYMEKGPLIFPKGGVIRQAFESRYDATVLRNALVEVFGKDKRLAKDSICRLVIPSVRAESGQACVITTPHHIDRKEFKDITAVEAGLATSAAPTFFKQATVHGKIAKTHYFDGGVWANNPIMAGITEAVRYLEVPPSRIEVLSVGTLSYENDFRRILDGGFLKWARPVSNLFMDSQQSGAELLATKLLGAGKVVRATDKAPRPIGLGDANALQELARRGQEVGQLHYTDVRQQFFDGYLVNDWRE